LVFFYVFNLQLFNLRFVFLLNMKFLRSIYFYLTVTTALVITACHTPEKKRSTKKVELDTYKNRTFFGVVDSGFAEVYPFINFERNHYQFYTHRSVNFEKLYYNIKQMIKYKDRKLNFYHIGGSHLQADVYTNEMRMFLETNWKGLPGERGLIFPFDLAGTNNPRNYHFASPNKWNVYKSTLDRPDSLDYGLLGMVLESEDSIIKVGFKYRKTRVKVGFDRIRVYHNKGVFPYDINLGKYQSIVVKIRTNEELGYTDIRFTENIDHFILKLTKNQPISYKFRLLGFQLTNNEPGISYTSIGVNGASLPTHLANKLFLEQLKETPPDFFAFSVGTNDANMPFDMFDPNFFKNNLDSLIQRVLHANPNCAILLTVPNDALFQKKHLNKNVARERKMIIQLAQKYEAAVWDMYGIMGELGSCKLWAKNGLMRNDFVHFTASGYHLKGMMFFESFLKWLEQMELYDKEMYYRK
jgi:lysophospholipase L1-like esterase